jgi:sister-chromatid-cohesion protein PDS5
MARARPPAEDEDGQHSSHPNALQFKEPLSWKAGRPIPTGTLINRLKTLCKELVALEQEGVDRDSLATPAKELVSVGLLQHKDPGVRAYTACCLADMLRLHAPDAPYTAVQLRVSSPVLIPPQSSVARRLVCRFLLFWKKGHDRACSHPTHV